MTQLFDETRHYQQTDPEILSLLGSKEKQAQMRHHGRSPAFDRLGRKIDYHGVDLNAWAEANRVDPEIREQDQIEASCTKKSAFKSSDPVKSGHKSGTKRFGGTK